jgi:DNA-binding HxlR family transcriptional regulator
MTTTLVLETEKKQCPIQKLAQILSDEWTVLIIRDLLLSPKRFCELEKSLVGISTRTLTLKLQKLVEEEVLINKDLYYTITKKGLLLKPVLEEMAKVGKKI